ncbi:MAG: hypothetical protein COV70_00830 [Parcubacteria group bacterium CG11_big_fil_rev_8_21_14_0_20_39_22]|nr:MAG: hypothetical protein COV70_00830 [Parcubacteria group bacterium CG11_big_fil_rev_8_21_14_0_20_39_22]
MDIEEQAEPKVYEVGYHIVPLFAEEELTGKVGELKGILEKENAVVISEDFPKLTELSYTMRKLKEGKYQKFDRAYFGWIKFEASPESVLRIADAFKSDEGILRSIVIKTVRENTFVPLRAIKEREEKATIGNVKGDKKEESKSPISEEELDKTIDELVVE